MNFDHVLERIKRQTTAETLERLRQIGILDNNGRLADHYCTLTQKMNKRDKEVLAALKTHDFMNLKPSHLTRVLNFDGECDWAPVGPPKQGEICASVPVKSRQRVQRVLDRLVKKDLVVKVYPNTRMVHYKAKP